MRKLLISLALILVIGGSSGLAYLYLKKDNNDNSQYDHNTDSIEQNASAEKLATDDFSNSPKVNPPQFTQAAWIPDWAGNEGLASFQTNARKLASVSPVWYEIKEDGSLKNKRPTNANQITTTARNNNVKLIPAIAMFDHEIFTKVLQDQANLDRHVDAIADEVEIRGYDGIDLDYESTKLSDKEKYFEFLDKLTKKLHKKDKELILTVLAKWEDNKGYTSLKETRAVQEWKELQKYADQIRIMSYDYTSFRAEYPGPIAPLFWMRQVLEYAVKHIPREKIILGIHLYSYEWYMPTNEYNAAKAKPDFTDPLSFHPISDFNLPISDRSARSYTYDTVKKLSGKFGGMIKDYEGEKYYRFNKANPQSGKMEERLLVYIDPAGVRARQDLAREFGIKGVVYWRLGGEDELLN